MNIDTNPFISICIPAYKRSDNIDNLISSISKQTFRDFEIVVTDDSPDDSLAAVIQKYIHLPIAYYKNDKPLGTPANWNYGISKARGQWIKLMHDDDWLASENSLELFAKETHSNRKFIFSAYTNITEDTKAEKKMTFPNSWRSRIVQNPLTLLSWNIIGPPSVTMLHRSITAEYDARMKWRVDIDFYVRILKEEKAFAYIETPLINVGISNSQVTNYCINQPEVELPEGLLLLQKYGVTPLKNILVYDTWWRIIRNVGIRRINQLEQYTKADEWPAVVFKMIKLQSHIPVSFLQNGFVSKACMCFSYLFNYRLLNRHS